MAHLLGYGLQHVVTFGGHVSRNRWRRVYGVDDAAVAQFGSDDREVLQATMLQDGALFQCVLGQKNQAKRGIIQALAAMRISGL